MSDDERHLRNLETYPDQRVGRPAPAAPVGVQPEPAEEAAMSNKRTMGVDLIAAERLRQMGGEGWTAEHDAAHDHDEMARAASIYALPLRYRANPNRPEAWPPLWDFKPSPGDRVRELTKAGALIAAEIDRLLGGGV